MLLYALHPEYSVVLIDEPEIHLHPGMIKKLLRVFMSEETNQIIVTSNSPVMVQADNLHRVYRVLRDERGSHVYSMGAYRRQFDRTRLVQELNADNLEMFFADKVLLVEGVSDRILMRGLIDRFYEGQDDIKVIYTHGKSNIETYVELLRIFHIPFHVMLDRDALFSAADLFRVPVPQRHQRTDDHREIYAELGKRNIHILPNGTIEHNYPRKYQIKDSKPLNALLAAANITEEEYRSPPMQHVRAIIEEL